MFGDEGVCDITLPDKFGDKGVSDITLPKVLGDEGVCDITLPDMFGDEGAVLVFDICNRSSFISNVCSFSRLCSSSIFSWKEYI